MFKELSNLYKRKHFFTLHHGTCIFATLWDTCVYYIMGRLFRVELTDLVTEAQGKVHEEAVNMHTAVSQEAATDAETSDTSADVSGKDSDTVVVESSEHAPATGDQTTMYLLNLVHVLNWSGDSQSNYII